MILVLAGTGDGRELAAELAAAGHQVLASAAMPHGSALLRSVPGITVREGRLDRAGLERLVVEKNVQGILDATHPFATQISTLVWDVACRLGVSYLRWERRAVSLPVNPLVHSAADWEEAVQCIAGLRICRVFLAVGVKPLEFLLRHSALNGCHFTVRVLPVPESVAACQRLGLRTDQIVACQGPGARRVNEALLEACKAQALVIKESGSEGGTGDKIAAAVSLGIHVIVVKRPASVPFAKAANCREDVFRWAAGVV